MNLDQMMNQADKIADYYDYLQQETFYILIDTFKKTDAMLMKSDSQSILLWRLEALSKIGALNKSVIKSLSKETGKTQKEIYQLIYDNGISMTESFNKELAKALKKPYREISPVTKEIISSYAHQVFRDVGNYVNQTLLTTNKAQNGAVKVYQDIVNKTVLEVTTGVKTPQRALRDNIYKWRQKGIKTTLTDKGGHNWGLEPYTRTVIRSTASRVYNDARMQSMKDFDTVLATMTSHPAARPACAPIQGKVVCIVPQSDSRYIEGYPSIYNHGYGEPAGCFGINCGHMLYPYIKGVSHNYQKQYDTKKAVENAKVQQKQRYYERTVRSLKREKQLAIKMNDTDKINEYTHKISGYQAKLREIVKDNNFLTRQYDREQIY